MTCRACVNAHLDQHFRFYRMWSCHGYGHVANAEYSAVRRVLWYAVMSVVGFIFWYFVVLDFIDFLDSSTNLLVRRHRLTNSSFSIFPAVIVCPRNRSSTPAIESVVRFGGAEIDASDVGAGFGVFRDERAWPGCDVVRMNGATEFGVGRGKGLWIFRREKSAMKVHLRNSEKTNYVDEDDDDENFDFEFNNELGTFVELNIRKDIDKDKNSMIFYSTSVQPVFDITAYASYLPNIHSTSFLCIYFKHASYHVFTEVPSGPNLRAFFAAFGGYAGLLVGGSLISALEFFEFCSCEIFGWWRKRKRVGLEKVEA